MKQLSREPSAEAEPSRRPRTAGACPYGKHATAADGAAEEPPPRGPERTRDATDVRVRPYAHTDADRIRRMPLSKQSLYDRFFGGTPAIPEHYVRKLRHTDHWDQEVLVATVGDEVIGIAEYVRDADERRRAELAVLVCDPWQGRGVGRLLVSCLSRLAARRGITEFGADVLVGNTPARKAVGRLWPRTPARWSEDGSARYLLLLRDRAEVPAELAATGQLRPDAG